MRRLKTRQRVRTPGAEERRQLDEGAGRLEHRVHRPLDLRRAPASLHTLMRQRDEAWRAQGLACVLAAKEAGHGSADEVLGRVVHRAVLVAFARGACAAVCSGGRVDCRPVGGHPVDRRGPGVSAKNAVESRPHSTQRSPRLAARIPTVLTMDSRSILTHRHRVGPGSSPCDVSSWPGPASASA